MAGDKWKFIGGYGTTFRSVIARGQRPRGNPYSPYAGRKNKTITEFRRTVGDDGPYEKTTPSFTCAGSQCAPLHLAFVRIVGRDASARRSCMVPRLGAPGRRALRPLPLPTTPINFYLPPCTSKGSHRPSAVGAFSSNHFREPSPPDPGSDTGPVPGHTTPPFD